MLHFAFYVFYLLFSLVAEEITQFSDQVKMRLISQLNKDISRVLQKLLEYFNDTSILTSFLLLALGDFPVILTLNLNDSSFTILSFG